MKNSYSGMENRMIYKIFGRNRGECQPSPDNGNFMKRSPGETREQFNARRQQLIARKEALQKRIAAITEKTQGPKKQDWENFKKRLENDFGRWNYEFDNIMDGHRGIMQNEQDNVLRAYEGTVAMSERAREGLDAVPQKLTYEKIGPKTWATEIPAGSTLGLKFDTYQNWQQFGPTAVAMGNFQMNGFHVYRDPVNRNRVIVQSNMVFYSSINGVQVTGEVKAEVPPAPKVQPIPAPTPKVEAAPAKPTPTPATPDLVAPTEEPPVPPAEKPAEEAKPEVKESKESNEKAENLKAFKVIAEQLKRKSDDPGISLSSYATNGNQLIAYKAELKHLDNLQNLEVSNDDEYEQVVRNRKAELRTEIKYTQALVDADNKEIEENMEKRNAARTKVAEAKQAAEKAKEEQDFAKTMLNEGYGKGLKIKFEKARRSYVEALEKTESTIKDNYEDLRIYGTGQEESDEIQDTRATLEEVRTPKENVDNLVKEMTEAFKDVPAIMNKLVKPDGYKGAAGMTEENFSKMPRDERETAMKDAIDLLRNNLYLFKYDAQRLSGGSEETKKLIEESADVKKFLGQYEVTDKAITKSEEVHAKQNKVERELEAKRPYNQMAEKVQAKLGTQYSVSSEGAGKDTARFTIRSPKTENQVELIINKDTLQIEKAVVYRLAQKEAGYSRFKNEEAVFTTKPVLTADVAVQIVKDAIDENDISKAKQSFEKLAPVAPDAPPALPTEEAPPKTEKQEKKEAIDPKVVLESFKRLAAELQKKSENPGSSMTSYGTHAFQLQAYKAEMRHLENFQNLRINDNAYAQEIGKRIAELRPALAAAQADVDADNKEYNERSAIRAEARLKVTKATQAVEKAKENYDYAKAVKDEEGSAKAEAEFEKARRSYVEALEKTESTIKDNYEDLRIYGTGQEETDKIQETRSTLKEVRTPKENVDNLVREMTEAFKDVPAKMNKLVKPDGYTGIAGMKEEDFSKLPRSERQTAIKEASDLLNNNLFIYKYIAADLSEGSSEAKKLIEESPLAKTLFGQYELTDKAIKKSEAVDIKQGKIERDLEAKRPYNQMTETIKAKLGANYSVYADGAGPELARITMETKANENRVDLIVNRDTLQVESAVIYRVTEKTQGMTKLANEQLTFSNKPVLTLDLAERVAKAATEENDITKAKTNLREVIPTKKEF